MRARDRLVQDLAECRRRREQGEQCDRDRVIAEFGGDPQRLADEILRHRCVFKHLAQALAWAAQGEPFGLMRAAGVPSLHESDGEQADVRDL
jgi:hypothetical protein